jgi:hypothetical protein
VAFFISGVDNRNQPVYYKHLLQQRTNAMKTISKTAAEKMLAERQISYAYFNSNKKYTILMPKEAAVNWLNALRSGEYIQSANTLHNPKTGGFCCLGVEQYCNNDGFVENSFEEYGEQSGSFLGYPTIGYQNERGYLFVDNDNSQTGNPQLRHNRVANLNDATTIKKVKVNQHKTKEVTVHVNDFAKMADLLEDKMLVY